MSEELKKSILSKSIDPEQLDQAAGGYEGKSDACQATVEFESWCWTNDACAVWDCTYDDCSTAFFMDFPD